MKTVEELLERLLCVDKTPLFCAQGDCGYAKGKHIPTRAELEELVFAATEQEREKIRNSAIIMPLTPFGTVTVPFSVLAPKG